MRVISGSAKGIKLESVPGKSTRPITDQVKEALFNILGMDVVEKRFLDLFGGTGAVGIEALSRGAEHVVFLDTNYRAYRVIQNNLETTGLDDYATVMMPLFICEKSLTRSSILFTSPHPNIRAIGRKQWQCWMKIPVG